jgi:type IV secretory pathway VirB2 component (pilin)
MAKKILAITVILMLVMALGATSVLASQDSGTIKDRVEAASGGGNGLTALDEKVNETTTSAVKLLRNIAITAAVLMFIFIAYGLIFSPNINTLVDCKGRVAALVVAIAIIFLAEEIVGTLLGFLA